jgi:hypothetical protein
MPTYVLSNTNIWIYYRYQHWLAHFLGCIFFQLIYCTLLLDYFKASAAQRSIWLNVVKNYYCCNCQFHFVGLVLASNCSIAVKVTDNWRLAWYLEQFYLLWLHWRWLLKNCLLRLLLRTMVVFTWWFPSVMPLESVKPYFFFGETLKAPTWLLLISAKETFPCSHIAYATTKPISLHLMLII